MSVKKQKKEDRISKISQYFKGMQVTELQGQKIIYVIVQFPTHWRIGDAGEKFNVTVRPGKDYPGQIFFFDDFSNGLENIFDAIDYVIATSTAIEERNKILQEKINDLSVLFADPSIPLSKLSTLSFSFAKRKSATKEEPTRQSNGSDGQTTAVNEPLPEIESEYTHVQNGVIFSKNLNESNSDNDE